MTGIDPLINIFPIRILFSLLLRYFWNAQKQMKNGIQLVNPINESLGSIKSIELYLEFINWKIVLIEIYIDVKKNG